MPSQHSYSPATPLLSINAIVKGWHPSHRAAYSSELPLARCGGHRLPGRSFPPVLDSAPLPTGHRRSPRVFGRNGNAVFRESTHSPVLEMRGFRVTLGIAVPRVSPQSLNRSWKNMRVSGTKNVYRFKYFHSCKNLPELKRAGYVNWYHLKQPPTSTQSKAPLLGLSAS